MCSISFVCHCFLVERTFVTINLSSIFYCIAHCTSHFVNVPCTVYVSLLHICSLKFPSSKHDHPLHAKLNQSFGIFQFSGIYSRWKERWMPNRQTIPPPPNEKCFKSKVISSNELNWKLDMINKLGFVYTGNVVAFGIVCPSIHHTTAYFITWWQQSSKFSNYYVVTWNKCRLSEKKNERLPNSTCW